MAYWEGKEPNLTGTVGSGFELTEISPQEIISPEKINANFDRLNTRITNFVLHEGSLNGWHWRLWDSGMVEFFNNHMFPEIKINIAWEGFLSTATLRMSNNDKIPLGPFSSVPYIDFKLGAYDMPDFVFGKDYWPFFNVSVEHQTNGLTPLTYFPGFCIYYQVPEAYKNTIKSITLKNVNVNAYGWAYLF